MYYVIFMCMQWWEMLPILNYVCIYSGFRENKANTLWEKDSPLEGPVSADEEQTPPLEWGSRLVCWVPSQLIQLDVVGGRKDQVSDGWRWLKDRASFKT